MMMKLTNRSMISSEAAPRRSNRRSFTLVEMMVVIGIIVMLLGLIVGVTVILMAKSETRETENILKIMDMAEHEWETEAAREITFGYANTPTRAVYDIEEGQYGPAGFQSGMLLSLYLKMISKNQHVETILAQISPDRLVRDANGNMRIVDPWDNKIKIIFPGRAWAGPNNATGWVGDPPTMLKDRDGTIRSTDEKVFGECINGRMLFVSFGPDGKPGNLHLDKALASLSPSDLNDIKAASDNIYSYAPLQDRP